MASTSFRHVPVWLRSFLKQEMLLVVMVLLAVGGLWVFIEVADEIEGGQIAAIDAWVLAFLHRSDAPHVPIGPDWLRIAALDLTALGSMAVLTLTVVLAAAYLGIQRQYRSMALVVVASVLGLVISTVLKEAFGRERPDEAMRLAEVSTASFPSGHSMLSAVIYLTLGAVIAATRRRRRERVYIMGAALLVAGIVGLTRVYIGVHYATDVLGGWALGLCWAIVCLVVAQLLRRRWGEAA